VRAVKRPTHALAHFLWRVVQVLDRPVASSGSSTPLVARAGRVNPNPEQPIMEAPLEGGGGGVLQVPDWNVFQVESTLVVGPGGIPPRTEGDRNYFRSQL